MGFLRHFAEIKGPQGSLLQFQCYYLWICKVLLQKSFGGKRIYPFMLLYVIKLALTGTKKNINSLIAVIIHMCSETCIISNEKKSDLSFYDFIQAKQREPVSF